MLLLANIEAYQDYLAKSPNLTNPTPEAFANARSSVGEFKLVGSDAIIPVTGPLSYKYDFWTYLMDGSAYQILGLQIAAAEADEDIDRIILLMDTPGGEVTGITELSEQIQSVSKPVIAVVDPMCASAGLWIASQADRIVMMKSGSIGSLGVQVMAVSLAEMYEKAGVDVRLIRANISPNKNMANPMEPFTEESVAYLQERVDKWGAEFLATVAKGRNVTPEQALEKFGQGHMLFGEEALNAGLVDEIGSLRSVVSEQGRSTRGRFKASFAAQNIRRIR